MLFKKKKRSEWMEGLLLAESLHRVNGYNREDLWRYACFELDYSRSNGVSLFNGFKDYIHNMRFQDAL